MRAANAESNAVIFDIDGTLWDASLAIAKAWNTYFEDQKLSYRTSSEQIRQLAGRPYLECLEAVTGPVNHSAAFLRELNDCEKHFLSTLPGTLYPGVQEGLRSLQESGIALGLVSNCEAWYLDCLLASVGPDIDWFGADCFGLSQIPKSDMLFRMATHYATTQNGRGRVLAYVGDTMGDLQAATDCKIPFVGVEYGFGNAALKAAGVTLSPTFISVVERVRLPEVVGRQLESR